VFAKDGKRGRVAPFLERRRRRVFGISLEREKPYIMNVGDLKPLYTLCVQIQLYP